MIQIILCYCLEYTGKNFLERKMKSKVITLLQAKGLNPIAVQNPLSSLADDVAATKRVFDYLGGPILLCGHSWGGAVITEAGNDSRVVGLAYVSAMAPNSGQSVNEWWKTYKPAVGIAEIKPFGNDGYVAVTRKGIETCFVH